MTVNLRSQNVATYTLEIDLVNNKSEATPLLHVKDFSTRDGPFASYPTPQRSSPCPKILKLCNFILDKSTKNGLKST